jgi:hypothetical protein
MSLESLYQTLNTGLAAITSWQDQIELYLGLGAQCTTSCSTRSRFLTSVMRQMIHAQPEQIHHMLVIESVIDLLAISPPTNQAQVAQSPELVRHSRLTHVQSGCQITDTQLSSREQRHDADSCWVAQGLESLSKPDGRRVIHEVMERCLYSLPMDVGFCTPITNHHPS